MSGFDDLTEQDKLDIIADDEAYERQKAIEDAEGKIHQDAIMKKIAEERGIPVWNPGTIPVHETPKIIVPVDCGVMKTITFRFRVTGIEKLREIMRKKGREICGHENAFDLSMVICMALEEFITRENGGSK